MHFHNSTGGCPSTVGRARPLPLPRLTRPSAVAGGPYAPAPRQMMLFWFGPAFQGARRSAYESLRKTVGVPLHLVTAENLHQYVLPEHPLHPAFEYLSPVHKSDYLFSYFSHHVGGAFHDVKVPFGNWSSWFDVINADHKIWLLGTRLQNRDGVACQEAMAVDDPECLALRSTRGENASHWRPVAPEYPTAYIHGVFDPFDGTRGACCERVRDNWQHTIDCQQHIARPRTPLTADWLRLAHVSLDKKLNALKAHSYPRPRCCMNHEGGYPMNWAELKGNTLFPMEVKYMKHVNGSMPQKPFVIYRSSAEEHF